MPYWIVWHHKKWLNPEFYLVKSKIKAKDREELGDIMIANFGTAGVDFIPTFVTELAGDYDGADLLK